MTRAPGTLSWRTTEIDDTNVWAIYDAGGHLLADVYPVELEPNARERARSIVTAVNAHAPLLEALERVNQRLKNKYRGPSTLTEIILGPTDVETIREALRLARGRAGMNDTERPAVVERPVRDPLFMLRALELIQACPDKPGLCRWCSMVAANLARGRTER